MLLLLLTGIWQWWVYLRSPQRVAQQFLAAIERRDVDTIYALTMAKEKSQMGVTKEVISRVLQEILYRQSSQVKAIATTQWFHAENWYRQLAAWGEAVTGKQLPSKNESGTLNTLVDLFRSPEGRWEVSFTRFASGYIIVNISKPMFNTLKGDTVERALRTRRHRRALLQQWDIKEVYPEPSVTIVNGRRIALLGTKAYDPISRYEGRGGTP